MTFPNHARRLRYGAILLIGVFGVGASIATGRVFRTWEHREAERDFQNRAQDRLRIIASDFSEAAGLLYTLRSLMEATERPLSANEFDRFAAGLHRGAVGLRDAGWAPHVTAAERDAFERRMRDTLIPDFRLQERDGARLVPAKPRSEYYPVVFSEGPEDAKRVLGLDLGFEARRRAAIARAIESGRPSSTPPLDLVTIRRPRGGMISFLAVGPGKTGADAPMANGVVFGVFDISLMFENIVTAKTNLTDLDVYFFDQDAAPGDAPNYMRLSSSNATAAETQQSLAGVMHWTGTLPIMDQTWTAVFTPARGHTARQEWNGAMPLGIGMAMTATITLYMFMTLRRNEQLQALTASLRRTTEELHLRAEEVSFLARHDALTGLPNRTLFKERLEDAVAGLGRGRAFALLCVDLDRFKAVNDTRGHAVGDQLLIQAAKRMRACARAGDTVARVGGDEFTIILREIAGREDPANVAHRMIEAVSAGYVIEGNDVSIGASIGIAVAPDHGHVAEVLMIRADLALYDSKNGGRGMFRFFDSRMDLPSPVSASPA